MKVLLLLATLFGFAHGGPTATHQTLSIVLNSENASLQRLPHYRTSAPIAVHVAGDAQKFDAVTITATGPDGRAIRAPLARTSDGFDGALRLVTPGAWTIALTTQLGSVSSAINAVSLDVEPIDGSEIAGYAGLLLSFVLTAAGVLIIVRRNAYAAILATVRATRRS